MIIYLLAILIGLILVNCEVCLTKKIQINWWILTSGLDVMYGPSAKGFGPLAYYLTLESTLNKRKRGTSFND